jgi:hypothetical protein
VYMALADLGAGCERCAREVGHCTASPNHPHEEMASSPLVSSIAICEGHHRWRMLCYADRRPGRR